MCVFVYDFLARRLSRIKLILILLAGLPFPAMTAVSLDAIYNASAVARLVSGQHYTHPDFETVLQHTADLVQFNQYLKTLDPHSELIQPDRVEFLRKRSKDDRVGIGFNLLLKKGVVLAVPIPDGPAYRMGIMTPVYVHRINANIVDIDNFSSYRWLAELSIGDRLSLEYKTESKALDIQRIELTAALYERQAVGILTDKNNLILQIRQIRSGEIHNIEKALRMSAAYKQLIIDLRYSTGGDVFALVDWLSLLLDEDTDVIKLNGQGDFSDSIVLTTLQGKVDITVPVVILVSEFTASSAEILARIVRQELPGVRVMGEASKGKCLAQSSFSLGDGSLLKLSVFNVEVIGFGACEGVPIMPDITRKEIALDSVHQIGNLLDNYANDQPD